MHAVSFLRKILLAYGLKSPDREIPLTTSRAIHIRTVSSLRENITPPTEIHASMEAFHLLSRGGVNFDKQRFKSDVKLFRVRLTLTQFIPVDFFPSNFTGNFR